MRQSDKLSFPEFKFVEYLGEGAYGEVNKYKHVKTGELFAFKQITKEHKGVDKFSCTPESEMQNYNNFIARFPAFKGTSIKKAIINQGILIRPYFDGDKPAQAQVNKCLLAMVKAGFVMGDPSLSNFLVTMEYGTIPIDFGGVFHVGAKNFTAEVKHFLRNVLFDYPGVPESFLQFIHDHTTDLEIALDTDTESPTAAPTLQLNRLIIASLAAADELPVEMVSSPEAEETPTIERLKLMLTVSPHGLFSPSSEEGGATVESEEEIQLGCCNLL